MFQSGHPARIESLEQRRQTGGNCQSRHAACHRQYDAFGQHLLDQVAAAGAERTKQFQAKFGKARNLGERSLGHQDPGATSITMFFAGFAEGAAPLEI